MHVPGAAPPPIGRQNLISLALLIGLADRFFSQRTRCRLFSGRLPSTVVFQVHPGKFRLSGAAAAGASGRGKGGGVQSGSGILGGPLA